MPRRRHPKNIRPWKGGYQTYGEVSGRPFPSKSWPATATHEEMKAHVDQQKRDLKVVGPKRGSFAEDVAAYLSRIVAVRSYKMFERELGHWLAALGRDRPRRTIKAAEIDQAMQRWERDGVGVETIRKRRMVLMALWNRLDGKDAPNPIRASRVPHPAKAEARGLLYPKVDEIIAAMPTRTEKQRAAQRRVRVIAYTGIPPGTLARVTAHDLDLKAGTIRISARRKGRGVEARTLPLIPAGLTAFKAFDAAGDYGAFRSDLVSRAFKHAARRVQLPNARLYDMRHSFASALYRATKDLPTVARFLQHSSITLTQRYAQSATEEVDKAAAVALGRSLSQKPVPKKKPPMKKPKK